MTTAAPAKALFADRVSRIGTEAAFALGALIAEVEADGEVQNWMIEAGPPGALVRRGWTRESVVPGTEVLVEGYQAIDGAFRANGRDVTFPDGRRLFAGSSGTGAPLDGRDATEPAPE